MVIISIRVILLILASEAIGVLYALGMTPTILTELSLLQTSLVAFLGSAAYYVALMTDFIRILQAGATGNDLGLTLCLIGYVCVFGVMTGNFITTSTDDIDGNTSLVE